MTQNLACPVQGTAMTSVMFGLGKTDRKGLNMRSESLEEGNFKVIIRSHRAIEGFWL